MENTRIRRLPEVGSDGDFVKEISDPLIDNFKTAKTDLRLKD